MCFIILAFRTYVLDQNLYHICTGSFERQSVVASRPKIFIYKKSWTLHYIWSKVSWKLLHYSKPLMMLACLVSFCPLVLGFYPHCEGFILLYTKSGGKKNSSWTTCMQGNSVSQINIRKPFFLLHNLWSLLIRKGRAVSFLLLCPWVLAMIVS